uniref:Uncharacterized protein n=1 Tax=Amorphochlora amoebiformis TaxID=1561963 RepID=A0A7S0GZS3_9EUKA|mmetsp:Transcript_23706/g.37290  ORF Transcript_23706/g.37290 Transcript_23706/m.37290 type:complete len:271 (+) Transcript_23706:131-943(+)
MMSKLLRLDIAEDVQIAVPSLSDWNCQQWDSIDAKIFQGSDEYSLTKCDTDACKRCRKGMEEAVASATLGMLALIPVAALVVLSKCCHWCLSEKTEKKCVLLGVVCLIGGIVSWTAGLRNASSECSDFNLELATTQSGIWNATTNGFDNSDNSIVMGPSAYLGIGTIACGTLALLAYSMYFFFMTGAAWSLFLVIFNGALSVGLASASLSLNLWYWSGIEKHSDTTTFNGESVEYTFYTMISYGITEFCMYPKQIPQLSSWRNLGKCSRT